MNKKFRIIVAGIGGVGGYFGGKLADRFTGSEEAEIIFYARGKNLEAIRENGLSMQTAAGNSTVHPAIATDNASEAGIADLIICCVKSYHLESVIEELKPCIGKETAVLPLLNGVDAAERLQKLVPGTGVWNGCVYIVSKLSAAGMIEQKGTVNALHFGAENGDTEKLKYVLQLFLSAGINAELHTNITRVTWQKFVFISTIGTLTSYLNTSIGEILNNGQHKKLLIALLTEITGVAKAKQIGLPEDIIESTLKRLESMPPETTSSMQLDVAAGKQTEAETLTGYVIRRGKELNVPTPTYKLVAERLTPAAHFK